MNRKEFISEVAKRNDMYKIDVEEILKVMEEVILENVKDSVRPFSFLTIKLMSLFATRF